MSGKDLPRVTPLIGVKLESKPGILTCRMFHPVTRDSPGTVLFLVLLQSDSSVSLTLPDLVTELFFSSLQLRRLTQLNHILTTAMHEELHGN